MIHMIRRIVTIGLLCFGGLLTASVGSAQAQGLIWTLPPDGSEVRYEGTYSYVDRRPGSSVGEIDPWIKHLWIRSVGAKMAEYKGETVPCRWIEIKVVTGRVTEDGLDPGPAGARLYKILVPETAVVGKLVDDEQIPVSMIPIVVGYRKFGDGPVMSITSKVLQVYPLISLLQHYKQLKSETGQAENPGIRLGDVQAVEYTGEMKVESRRSRSHNTGVLWRSRDVPFGVAKWTVKILLEAKGEAESRSEFKPVSEITVEMQAHEIAENAQSELPLPSD